jgi:hypothetical protein
MYIYIYMYMYSYLLRYGPGGEEPVVGVKNPVDSQNNGMSGQQTGAGVMNPVIGFDSEKDKGICLLCHVRVVTYSRCSKCKLATYCSRVCQTKDWGQHKVRTCLILYFHVYTYEFLFHICMVICRDLLV